MRWMARSCLCAGGLMLVVMAAAAAAAAHGGGSFSEVALPERAVVPWLAQVPDSTPVRELSLPGTHDTMARFGGLIAETQSTPLRGQLDAGVRALDIRLRHQVVAGLGVFIVTHGPVPEARFDVVMSAVNGFLDDHPSETVLMRVKRDEDDTDRAAFNATFDRYMFVYGEHAWESSGTTNPALGELRGTVVFLPQGFDARRGPAELGIPWNDGNFNIQDRWQVCSRPELADTWGAIKTHFRLADSQSGAAQIFVNHLSGNRADRCLLAPVNPRFVASGLEDGTFEPAFTGTLIDCTEPQDVNAPGWTTCPSFFHVDVDAPLCGRSAVSACPVYYEGTNALALLYLRGGYVNRRAGLVMIDFPAAGLIDAIIALNPTNEPPVADAGGPYAGVEGTVVALDASGSTDPNGDALRYRWDFDVDGTWDTAWSSDPVATTTWADDHVGTVRVEVSDGAAITADVAAVTVANVAPDVSIDSREGCLASAALVAVPVELSGRFTDPGSLDTHRAGVTWGDGGTDELGAVAPGTSIGATHTFTAAGERTAALAVTDDDGGVGSDSLTLTVYDAAGAIRAVIAKLDEKLAEERDADVISALRATRADLDGDNGGRARNGAADGLDRGKEAVALKKVIHALAHSADDALGEDMSGCRTLLALAARSLAQIAYDDATASARNRSQRRNVERLETSLRAGVDALDAGDLSDAVTHFRHVVARA